MSIDTIKMVHIDGGGVLKHFVRIYSIQNTTQQAIKKLSKYICVLYNTKKKIFLGKIKI
jgi:hypothetical protein